MKTYTVPSYTVTTYDAADIGALKLLNRDEVISILEDIERGYLPPDYIVGGTEGREYSESQYNDTRLHAAIWRARELLMKLPKEDA